MSRRLLNGVTAIGASQALRLPNHLGVKDHTIIGRITPTGVTAVTGLTMSLQGSNDMADAVTGVVTGAGLVAASSGGGNGKYPAIGQQFTYLINGMNYTVNAATAGQSFNETAGNTVNAAGTGDKFGAINLYIDAAGTIHSTAPATNQAYTSAALAVAAAQGVTSAPPTWCLIGMVIIEANALTWTANTTTFAGATNYQFVSKGSGFKDVLVHQCTAAELVAGSFMDSIRGFPFPYARLCLEVLTGGACTFNGIYAPDDSD